MKRFLLAAVLGGVTFAAPVQGDDRDDYEDYLEERQERYEDYLEDRRERYEEWREDRPRWGPRYAPRWEVYTVPEFYPTYGGSIPGYRFNERFSDPVRGFYYSRYGRRALPPVVVPAYPYYPPPAWGGVYYPY
jgi:hypothetical protein